MEKIIFLLICLLIFIILISICLLFINLQYKDLIDSLEKDSANDYRLILEYQKAITKLNKKIEEKEKNNSNKNII